MPPLSPERWQAAGAHLDTSLAGTVLGAYTLTAPIGAGGMGTVWLAARNDGRFEGRVAVKLLNAALTGRGGGEARFRREGQVLARLDHPGIARLLDAGVAPFGAPYLVLEYVDGEPIDRYGDRHGLGVEARVRLFLDVLDAVAHAHARLVVHRDIKPSNVLVRADGRVKLLDFGIAKLVPGFAPESEGWPADAASDGAGAVRAVHEGGGPAAHGSPDEAATGVHEPLTRLGARVMTPGYAAPEQIVGDEVTTATDVYALGVLLFVLLAGRHPWHDETTHTTREAAGGGTAVVRPSDRASSPALRRALSGDLDAIVARALRARPADRYQSATAFADDLRRHLAHEPVEARPATAAYRAGRFVRRHAAGVVAACGVLALVSALVGVNAARLAEERDRARREAGKAAQVSALLTDLLTESDPFAGPRDHEPTVRGVLDAGAARLETRLAGQPDVQAELLTTIGRIYQRLGALDEAGRLLERALALAREVDPGHERVARALNDLGVLRRERGDPDAARPLLEEAVARRRAQLGPDHPDLAVSLVELGRALDDEGATGRAEALFREALAIRRRVLGPADRDTATSESDLGLLLWDRGDLEGAEPLLRAALETTRQALGARHADVGTALSNIALVVGDRGDHGGAEALFREALAVKRETLGDGHTSVAITLNNLSHALRELGRYDEAEAGLVEALAIARPSLGEGHPLVATFTMNLGRVHLARGDAAAAEPHLRHALEVRRGRHAPGDWRIGAAASLLGAALAGLGRYGEAEPLLVEARDVLRDVPGPQGREARATRDRLAALYEAMGRRDAAAAARAAALAPAPRP